VYWSETEHESSQASDAACVDVWFRVEGRKLPVDHIFELRGEVGLHLPWLLENVGAGLQPVSVAPAANGWMRPDPTRGETLQLSRRTRLMMRVPAERASDCKALEGKVLHIRDCALRIGGSSVRPLLPSPAVFARQVVIPTGKHDEQDFLSWFSYQLSVLGIRALKLLPGMRSELRTSAETLHASSMLVAELTPAQSMRLQCAGVGAHRSLGCGLFIPHKDIAAVGDFNSDD